MPERFRLSRSSGWRMPPGGMSVARPSRWGNPFFVGGDYRWAEGQPCPFPRAGAVLRDGDSGSIVRCQSVEQAVAWFRTWATEMNPTIAADARQFLAGHDLGCWCGPDRPCHADVLLEIANQPVPEPAGG